MDHKLIPLDEILDIKLNVNQKKNKGKKDLPFKAAHVRFIQWKIGLPRRIPMPELYYRKPGRPFLGLQRA
jgi:hypothetical protein